MASKILLTKELFLWISALPAVVLQQAVPDALKVRIAGRPIQCQRKE